MPVVTTVDRAALDRHIAETYRLVADGAVDGLHFHTGRAVADAARVLRPGGRLALSDSVTDREIKARTTSQADLWAACIAGAAQRDDYLGDLAAAGLQLVGIRDNPAYRFASDRAQRAAGNHGARSVSLLAGKPVRITTTTTQEVDQ